MDLKCTQQYIRQQINNWKHWHDVCCGCIPAFQHRKYFCSWLGSWPAIFGKWDRYWLHGLGSLRCSAPHSLSRGTESFIALACITGSETQTKHRTIRETQTLRWFQTEAQNNLNRDHVHIWARPMRRPNLKIVRLDGSCGSYIAQWSGVFQS